MRDLPGRLPDQSLVRTESRAERVVLQGPLHRILAFTRRSIDDVVNDPVVKNQVLGYYKLQQWVQRGCEIVDLERQWNG